MIEGEQLTDAELLRIAESIKSDKNKKIPDYLSDEDKKTVKELLDILYARDKAVKTYFCKLQYLDALKKAQDLKQAQESKKLEAQRRYKDYKDYAVTAAKIRDASQKATAYLNSGYAIATESIQKAVVNLGHDLFLCLDSRPSKRKVALKTMGPPTADGRSEVVYEPSARYIRARVYRDFGSDELPFGKQMSIEERERLQAYLKETRSPFTFTAFTASAQAKDAAVDNLLANPEALGDVSKKLSAELDRRAQEQRKASQSMRGKAYGYQTKEYYESIKDVDVKRERLRLASGWYVVAAVGDLLCQFAQSLMNS